MKRTPLRRAAPLQRRARLAARRARPRRSDRLRDPEYMAWVRTLRCCAHDLSPCYGRVEADHAGRRPLGRKSSDRETIPMCRRHHQQRTDGHGPFRAWPADHQRAWCDAAIAHTQALHAARHHGAA